MPSRNSTRAPVSLAFTPTRPTRILAYMCQQPAKPRIFPGDPPKLWAAFVRAGGNRAHLRSVLVNRGEVSNVGGLRTFDLVVSERLADLMNRLVIGW